VARLYAIPLSDSVTIADLQETSLRMGNEEGEKEGKR
jgi:hypothetical protein